MGIRTYGVVTMTVLLGAFSYASNSDYDEVEQELLRYCERVVQFEVEAVRGVPISQRNGHRDHKGIAAEHCPGMRPAP